jgi:hypothetical protein
MTDHHQGVAPSSPASHLLLAQEAAIAASSTHHINLSLNNSSGVAHLRPTEPDISKHLDDHAELAEEVKEPAQQATTTTGGQVEIED